MNRDIGAVADVTDSLTDSINRRSIESARGRSEHYQNQRGNVKMDLRGSLRLLSGEEVFGWASSLVSADVTYGSKRRKRHQLLNVASG